MKGPLILKCKNCDFLVDYYEFEINRDLFITKNLRDESRRLNEKLRNIL
jgi:hypothetical protein